jgi:hypothetical protein
VFAKHFSDVHVVIKQQHLETKASFRDPGDTVQTRTQTKRLQSQALDKPGAAPERIASRSGRGETRKPVLRGSRRRALISICGAAAVAVAVGYTGIWPGRPGASGTGGTDTTVQDASHRPGH